MEALSVRDYRRNLASSFERASVGDPVIIRRKNHLYALVSLGHEDLALSPRLKKRIEDAEKACREGRYVACRTPEEITTLLDSL